MIHFSKWSSRLFLAIAIVWNSTEAATVGTPNRDFVMLYQFTKSTSDPVELNRQMYPMSPVKISYEPRFNLQHHNTQQSVPSARIMDIVAKKIHREMQAVDHDFVILDIETWRVDRSASPPVVAESIAKYVDVIQEMKHRLPEYRVGNYGKPVHRDYEATKTRMRGQAFQDWVSLNSQLKTLADVSDIMYPSLYTFDLDDRESWRRYAAVHIEESRRLANNGQPVIAFVWPMYHDRSPYKGRFIDYDFWRFQLDTLWELTDGVVIWSNQQGANDMTLGWYRATRDFISECFRKGATINGRSASDAYEQGKRSE